MNINLHVMHAKGRLDQFESEITNEFARSIKKIQKLLPIKNVDIVVRDAPDEAIETIGMGGHTYGPDFVLVSMDPTFPDFTKALQEQFSRTLAHELHHVVRWQHIGYGNTLLQAMITEGLADHFDQEVNNSKPNPWITALSLQEIQKFLLRAKEEFNNKKYNHWQWFFGSKERGIPRWTGYSMGYHLVGEYLKKHPKEKPSTLYKTKAEIFIK